MDGQLLRSAPRISSRCPPLTIAIPSLLQTSHNHPVQEYQVSNGGPAPPFTAQGPSRKRKAGEAGSERVPRSAVGPPVASTSAPSRRARPLPRTPALISSFDPAEAIRRLSVEPERSTATATTFTPSPPSTIKKPTNAPRFASSTQFTPSSASIRTARVDRDAGGVESSRPSTLNGPLSAMQTKAAEPMVPRFPIDDPETWAGEGKRLLQRAVWVDSISQVAEVSLTYCPPSSTSNTSSQSDCTL